MLQINDHPDITSAIRTGYPKQRQKRTHRCPNCGVKLDDDCTIYTSINGVIGCEKCIEAKTVVEALNE